MIVFDRVARPDHRRLSSPGMVAEQRALHLFRQRCGDAVGINRVVVESLRLEENLMAVTLAEPHDLVFDRRAIARTATGDLAGIHRRAMHIGADDFMRGVGGAGDAALDLRIVDPVGQHRKRLGRIIARLHLHGGPVDGAAVEPRRRSGFQPAKRKAEALQRERKPQCRRLADAAGRASFSPRNG